MNATCKRELKWFRAEPLKSATEDADSAAIFGGGESDILFTIHPVQ